MKKKSIVLLSGGMDSLVTAAIAVRKYEPAFLHINYGQKTSFRELKAFNDIAEYYKVDEKLVVDLAYFSEIGGSSLTDNRIEIAKADFKSKEIPASYVPFRNANLLSIAVSWAEVIAAEKVFIGAVEEDSSGYPDCRKEFYDAFNKVIELGTKSKKITIETPIIHLKKHEIIRKGAELNVPFELTWSCYKNNEKACGECDSCALRLRGFQLAGIEDPIEYITKPSYI